MAGALILYALGRRLGEGSLHRLIRRFGQYVFLVKEKPPEQSINKRRCWVIVEQNVSIIKYAALVAIAEGTSSFYGADRRHAADELVLPP